MVEEEKPELTKEEEDALREYYGGGAPLPEEKHNVHSFLNRVATSRDTTKTGNLTAEEIGLPRINLRTLKEVALIARKIMNKKLYADYYEAKGEILTSTSLSKNATLINLAVIQKRQIEDQTPDRKENKGWFKPKEGNQVNPQTGGVQQ